MSKTSRKKQAAPASEPKSSGRLDQAISDVASKTVKGIQKYRVVLITLILTVVAVGMGLTGLEKLQESRDRQLSERLYTLLKEGETGKDPTELFDRIDEILEVAEGHRSERIIYKDTVGFLVADVEARLFPQESPPSINFSGAPNITLPKEERDLDLTSVPATLAKAKELVERARDRFPDDPEFQEWAKFHTSAIHSFANPRTRGSKGSFRTTLPPDSDKPTPPPDPSASANDTAPDPVKPEAPDPSSPDAPETDAPSGKELPEAKGSGK